MNFKRRDLFMFGVSSLKNDLLAVNNKIAMYKTRFSDNRNLLCFHSRVQSPVWVEFKTELDSLLKTKSMLEKQLEQANQVPERSLTRQHTPYTGLDCPFGQSTLRSYGLSEGLSAESGVRFGTGSCEHVAGRSGWNGGQGSYINEYGSSAVSYRFFEIFEDHIEAESHVASDLEHDTDLRSFSKDSDLDTQFIMDDLPMNVFDSLSCTK